MKMTKTKEIIILIIVVAIVGAIWWVQSAKQEPRLSSEYETVNFCGREYEAPVIVIDGVHIIKRIAEAASAEEGGETCREIISAGPEDLAVSFEEHVYSPDWYSLHLNGYLFEYGKGHTMIVRPGPHGIEGWVPLKK